MKKRIKVGKKLGLWIQIICGTLESTPEDLCGVCDIKQNNYFWFSVSSWVKRGYIMLLIVLQEGLNWVVIVIH